MNAEYIQQHNIAQRYLHGKLTPEETVEFEEYFLDKPELLEQLEVDSVLVEHLPKVTLAKKQTRMANFWRGLFGTPLRASAITFATCAFVSLSLFNVSIHSTNNEQQKLSNVIVNPTIDYVSELRSINTLPKEPALSFKRQNLSAVIVLQPQSNAENSFSVHIKNSQGVTYFFTESIELDYEGNVVLILNLNDFTADQYEIELQSAQKQTVLKTQFLVLE